MDIENGYHDNIYKASIWQIITEDQQQNKCIEHDR